MPDRAEKLRDHITELASRPDLWGWKTALLTAHETPDGSVYLSDIGISDETWAAAGDEPIRVVEGVPFALSVRKSESSLTLATEGFFGWVFRHTAYTLDIPRTELSKYDVEMLRNGRLHTHPKAKKALTYTGVTTDMSVMLAIIEQGNEVAPKYDISRVNAFGMRTHPELADARLPLALMTACAAVIEIGADE